MILVTGATGTAGGAVLAELMARGASEVRAMHRSAGDREKLPSRAQSVIGDFADPPSLRHALAGVDAAYLVCAPVPGLVELETNFLLACAQAKIKHVVINSALGAADFPKSFPSWHRKVEDKSRELGLPVTILRPNGFMQNIATYFLPTVRSHDTFYGAIGDAAISFIDIRDVAAAAAEALMNGVAMCRTYELSGPQAVTLPALAEKMSKVKGRPVKYVNLDPEAMNKALIASGLPPAQATAIIELDEYYRSGKGAAADTGTRSLVRRELRTVDEYLKEIAGEM